MISMSIKNECFYLTIILKSGIVIVEVSENVYIKEKIDYDE
jgi:hypothetical protein